MLYILLIPADKQLTKRVGQKIFQEWSWEVCELNCVHCGIDDPLSINSWTRRCAEKIMYQEKLIIKKNVISIPRI